jgi:hypothetical protein
VGGGGRIRSGDAGLTLASILLLMLFEREIINTSYAVAQKAFLQRYFYFSFFQIFALRAKIWKNKWLRTRQFYR